MNPQPRQKLRELVDEYGHSLCDNPRRFEALLKDYCGVHKREIFVLVSALKKRVAEDLLKAATGVPQTIVKARLQKRLEEELAITAEAAHWAVESWAHALEMIQQQPLPVVKSVPVSLPVPSMTAKVISIPLYCSLETLLAERYRDNGDGTLTDVRTGLQWMRFSLGQKWKSGVCTGKAKAYKWQQALEAVEALNDQGGHAGYWDWRAPTKEELLTLVYCSSGQPKTWNDSGQPCWGDYERPTIYQRAFPNTPNSWFWTTSTEARAPAGAVGVSFYCGFMSVYPKAYYGYVRLVRSR
jgi:hypothetical protein